MIILLLTLPLIAYLSMIAFQSMQLAVRNYQCQLVPYSLGVVIFYSYCVLYSFPPFQDEVFSFQAFLFIFSVWLLGFIDDRLGTSYPKGLKGHLVFAREHRKVTTGLLKAGGTIIVALLYLWSKQPMTFMQNLLAFFLLTGLPHVMNLFDTRPLRVWKVALCFTVLLFYLLPLPPLLFVVTVLAVFYISFVLEGHRKVMLGDNGATVTGAIFAVILIHHSEVSVQSGVLLFVFVMMILAEKISLSAVIERWTVLKRLDQLGVSKK
ncbi:hypothetical protein [Halalkalibacter oceani]|uniref:Uncharacterized protein n=1 Tax=Halalkalibacter oceani TaxID=1653776 RepID=A0A9X2DQJ7_9BACI|nr:hypothetical protein [Halalkalibacter oceani]MCM3715224.1 hypothetical protein [Halalkalibacter oceani]